MVRRMEAYMYKLQPTTAKAQEQIQMRIEQEEKTNK